MVRSSLRGLLCQSGSLPRRQSMRGFCCLIHHRRTSSNASAVVSVAMITARSHCVYCLGSDTARELRIVLLMQQLIDVANNRL